MIRRLLPLGLLSLPLALACGDKDEDTDGDGGALDDTGGDCTLELAPAGDVTTDPTCEAVVDKLAGIEVEWQWSGNETYAGYNSVIGPPAVGDLDGDGVPEIAFTATYPPKAFFGGLLVVLDGQTGEEELVMYDLGDKDLVSDVGGPAIADLDGDGLAEIIVPSLYGALAAIALDGTILWKSATQSSVIYPYAPVGVADMDGDGTPEVYAGGAIFGADGGFEESSPYGVGGAQNSSIVVDLDGDGQQELIAGVSAIELDGEVYWDLSKKMPDFAGAAADFDGDGDGDVVGVAYGHSVIVMLDTDGSLLWYTKVDGGYGGTPCVADFDADGSPEFAVVGLSTVAMYESDGTVLWSRPVLDGGYGLNGCSGFDFDDDGGFELLYADDEALFVVDGATGEEILVETGHAGLSLVGYPLVVDVDGDGKTEIVLGSNDANGEGWAGITVLRDLYDAWSPTRKVWNQHAYHQGNIDDDLTVPADPAMPWSGGDGGFRTNTVFERGSPTAPASNLVALASDTCIECNAGLLKFEVAVQVANEGATDVNEDIGVGVYAVTKDGRRELVSTHIIEGGLPAGRSTDAFEVSGQFATAVGFTHLEAQVGGSQVNLDAGLPQVPVYIDCNLDDDVARVEFDCE